MRLSMCPSVQRSPASIVLPKFRTTREALAANIRLLTKYREGPLVIIGVGVLSSNDTLRGEGVPLGVPRLSWDEAVAVVAFEGLAVVGSVFPDSVRDHVEDGAAAVLNKPRTVQTYRSKDGRHCGVLHCLSGNLDGFHFLNASSLSANSTNSGKIPGSTAAPDSTAANISANNSCSFLAAY